MPMMTKVMVQQVFENPSAPLAIIYEVHIHCGCREIKKVAGWRVV